ncbi:peptidoglycan-binding domain-containing protein [Kamptonema formosum]|uniref:peptidoglycan-binding domain-containing protein n=1 Tax=Kamptonema formosum TaxID=331992 RepID=UPI000345328C|nr:peptidoglycan-binding protein [Oscillatoria sp. PCC 10802]
METLAYLELAVAREREETAEAIPASGGLNWFQRLNRKKPAIGAAIRWVSVALSVGLLSVTGSALAALQRGDTGAQVSAIQESLAAAGYYDGPITGYFGSLTETAVIRFQQAKGLPADGVVGRETEVALGGQKPAAPNPNSTPIPSSRALKQGDSGSDVKDLQTRLQAAGYYNGPLTSYFGSLTEAGVIRFQQDKGLTASGIADSATLAALANLGRAPAPGPNIPGPSAPNPNTGGSPSDLLQKGSTGLPVSDLQAGLQQLNYYDGPVYGYFDARTEGSVIRFQRDYGLRPDGIVGQQTWNALRVALEPPMPTPPPPVSPIPSPNASKSNVLALQQRLKDLGFYRGQLDGSLNSQTQAAIKAAQKRYGVSSKDILVKRF